MGGAVLGLAARDALAAAELLRDARSGLQLASDGDLAPGRLEVEAARADALLAEAEQRLERTAPAAVARVPVLGRSLVAERRVVVAGRAALAGVHAVVAAAPDLRGDGGTVDLAALQRLRTELEPLAAEAEVALANLHDAPVGLTPPQVGEGVREAAQALEPVVEGLASASTGMELAFSLLGGEGPRSVLVALQNNAELRGAGGFVSTYATGTFEDGRMRLEPFRDVAEVSEAPDRARQVPAPEEFREDYGPFLADTTLWKMWTMSPDVPDTAAVGAEVAATLLGQRPDVIILLDVPALAALVELAGAEVRLPDGTDVPPDRLVEALLVDSYAQAGTDGAAQDQRRAALSAAAGKAATDLLQADVAPLDAVRQLGRLARGRHLALWAAAPDDQARLVELGLAGAAGVGEADDLALVSVNNLTANKLDYYVDRSVSHHVVLHDDRAEVVQRVRLANRAPEGLVPYVDGGTSPGRSSLRIELSAAPDAELHAFTLNGRPAQGAVRTDADRTRAFTYTYLHRGESVDVELRYSVPVADGRYAVRLLPQPLARDASLAVTVEAADGEVLAGGEATLERSGPWQETEVLEVSLHRPGRWERLRGAVSRFLQEPVRIG